MSTLIRHQAASSIARSGERDDPAMIFLFRECVAGGARWREPKATLARRCLPVIDSRNPPSAINEIGNAGIASRRFGIAISIDYVKTYYVMTT
jgi:hypothetical protein